MRSAADRVVQRGGRVGARLHAGGGQLAGEPFGGERGGAGDDQLASGGLVGAGDPGQRSCSCRSRPVPRSRPTAACRTPARSPGVARQRARRRVRPARGRAARSPARRAPARAARRSCRRAARRSRPCPLAAAVLAGGAGPVGEHEDLLGCSQLAQRLERVSDRHAGRALERDRARVARGERRVKLGQPVEQRTRVRRRQRPSAAAEPVQRRPVEPVAGARCAASARRGLDG